MATTVAAMKGKLGSTDYFILTMKVQELVEKTKIPSEMEGWENMSLEEREQRDINYTRVKTQIAPYLASDQDRFFGAIILTARNFDPSNFEPIADVATKGLPNLYKTQAQLMGFLTFTGGELLIPLDGQHRLKALEFAIEGRDEKGKPIANFEPCSDLADEEVTVILVPYDGSKARKIFTKVNKYAKPTTTGQNLVTDDDDIVAVLSRKVANDQDIIGAHLVNYKSNTLSDKDQRFTTLATLAECNQAILEAHFPPGKIDRVHLPEPDKAKLYERKIFEVWKFLTENIDLFSEALDDKDSKDGDSKRSEIRQDYLLGKPVAQVCLVNTFAQLTTLEERSFSYEAAANKLNAVKWGKDELEWDRLFVSGGKIITKNRKLVTDILCYRAGKPLSKEQEENLLERYRALFPDDEKNIKELPPLL